jgi:uncharacterized protein YjiS (DUF1127 family)
MTVLPLRTSTSADCGGRKPHRRDMHQRPAAGLLATIRAWLARRRRRRTLGELTELDDHLLKDIGVSRQEAARECAKWFWQDEWSTPASSDPAARRRRTRS